MWCLWCHVNHGRSDIRQGGKEAGEGGPRERYSTAFLQKTLGVFFYVVFCGETVPGQYLKSVVHCAPNDICPPERPSTEQHRRLKYLRLRTLILVCVPSPSSVRSYAAPRLPSPLFSRVHRSSLVRSPKPVGPRGIAYRILHIAYRIACARVPPSRRLSRGLSQLL